MAGEEGGRLEPSRARGGQHRPGRSQLGSGRSGRRELATARRIRLQISPLPVPSHPPLTQSTRAQNADWPLAKRSLTTALRARARNSYSLPAAQPEAKLKKICSAGGRAEHARISSLLLTEPMQWSECNASACLGGVLGVDSADALVDAQRHARAALEPALQVEGEGRCSRGNVEQGLKQKMQQGMQGGMQDGPPLNWSHKQIITTQRAHSGPAAAPRTPAAGWPPQSRPANWQRRAGRAS